MAFTGVIAVTVYSSSGSAKSTSSDNNSNQLYGNIACFIQVVFMAISNTMCDWLGDLDFDALH
eukprot:CAMPEP_0116903164 /NCGR_PEP_ID=MMETSP0467-20121206/10557_1 /TAXON_ID=283647 /ORGANISM="Mesodinium pulex, Strain SPMC105" /LENGTH=62 /DNA_ID=CAMNT_0004577359 /DNA_START=324 /DNA_END=512 /DNA_ORIENTATION=+